MRGSAMLRKTIYSMPIIILTIGAACAQTDVQELQDIKSGQTSFRTQLEKKNDKDIDRAYQSTIKGRPDAEKNLIRGAISVQLLHQRRRPRISNSG